MKIFTNEFRMRTISAILSAFIAFSAHARGYYRAEVNTQNSLGQLPHFWQTLGLDHSALLLESRNGWGKTLKLQIAQAVNEIGLSGIRQHGILHDDVGIYREIQGNPVYDFSRSDQILDYYLSLGITPVIEFGSMPRDLASNPSATVFLWRQGISPPKNWLRWQDLIFQFVHHYSERYGAETVAKWYFEVWNEPDLSMFWRGSQQDYFKLYDFTVAGAHSANPKIRIGGPSPSGPHQILGSSRIGHNFIEHVKNGQVPSTTNRLPLDFFSVHTWNFLDANINGFFQTQDFLQERGYDIPILVTEAGPTWQFNLNPQPHDTMHGAAFIVDTISSMIDQAQRRKRALPEIWSWWVLSDIFEEGRYREQDPFIGCMGLLTRQGISKPAYNAFKLLHQMGHELLPFVVERSGTVKGFATRHEDGSLRVLIVNGKNPGRGPSDGRYYEESSEPDVINLNLVGLTPNAKYTAKIVHLDRNHGDAYTAWQKMGRPQMKDMDEADWQTLRQNMLLPQALHEQFDSSNPELSLAIPSPGIVMVEVQRDAQ